MATAMRKCKICGNEYEYCHTAKRIVGIFRWQDVACCPEHGSAYLAKVEASRSVTKTVADKERVDYKSVEIYDEDDSWVEDGFNDDEEEPVMITK